MAALRGRGQWGQNRPYVGRWSGRPGSRPNRPSRPRPNRPVRDLNPTQTGKPGFEAPMPLNPQALPVDPIYTEQVGAINYGYDTTLAGIGYDRTQVGQHYGFDPLGNLDPSNPYSVAANLQRRYQQGQRGTTNSMAARGQLYSGAHQRNLDEGTFQYQSAYDSARRSAMGAYQDLTERTQQAEHDRRIGLGQAGADRLARLGPQDTTPAAPAAQRVHPTRTTSHTAAGLRRIGPNTYVGPNGTKWHRTKNGTFARGR